MIPQLLKSQWNWFTKNLAIVIVIATLITIIELTQKILTQHTDWGPSTNQNELIDMIEFCKTNNHLYFTIRWYFHFQLSFLLHHKCLQMSTMNRKNKMNTKLSTHLLFLPMQWNFSPDDGESEWHTISLVIFIDVKCQRETWKQPKMQPSWHCSVPNIINYILFGQQLRKMKRFCCNSVWWSCP